MPKLGGSTTPSSRPFRLATCVLGTGRKFYVDNNRYGYVEFVDMQSVHVLFNDRPSFSEIVARAREELHCLGDDSIAIEGVLHLGSPPNILRRMIPIGCAD